MNIRVDLTTPITDGTEVVFRSPVDCSEITGLIVYCNDDSKEFALADAHGNNVGDIDHLFAENVVVKVILDVTHSMAYVQNADTNAYLEERFKELEDKISKIDNGPSAEAGGLTIAQINALDDLFRTAAYTTDVSGKYAAFRQVFGLADPSEPDVPDVPVDPDVPSDGWEVVRVVGADEITYGTNIWGTTAGKRAVYNKMDIPVEEGYKYKLTAVHPNVTTLSGGVVIAPGDATTKPSNGNVILLDTGWSVLDESGSFEITITSETVKDVTKLGWLAFNYKVTATNDAPNVGSIESVTISRKAVS